MKGARRARLRTPVAPARRAAWVALCWLAMLATGCSMFHARPAASGADASLIACTAWLDSVDRAVRANGVHDAGAYRVPGFPELRIDRFLASFSGTAAADPQQFQAWFDQAREQDRLARGFELSNLDAPSRVALGTESREDLRERTEQCAQVLAAADRQSHDRRAALLQRAHIPDDYSEVDRIVGVYPLARWPFEQGVEGWHRQSLAAFSANAADRGEVERWAAPIAAQPLPASEIADWIRVAQAAPLGLLQLDASGRERLFAAFAPVYLIETTDNDDRPGAPAFTPHAGLVVDTGQPTVYHRLAYTRFNGQTLPQLVYTIWFRARPARYALDPLAGRFDGLVFRITLGPDGRPLIYDSIHPCGCFHMFFPTAALKLRPPPHPNDEWAFVPQPGPSLQPGAHVQLRIRSHSHELIGLAGTDDAAGRAYRLDDEDRLRALPDGAGTRSLYGPDGLVDESKRLERLLFWPMGVSSAGTMRQWGHHATAFLGRRHFDDADLIEQRFSRVD